MPWELRILLELHHPGDPPPPVEDLITGACLLGLATTVHDKSAKVGLRQVGMDLIRSAARGIGIKGSR